MANVENLVEGEAMESVSDRDEDGNTLLHRAARRGQLSVVRSLVIEKRCDPMSRNNRGVTALHMAAAGGDLQVVRFLTDECGVDPMSCLDLSDCGKNPLHLAAGVVGHKLTCLHLSAMFGHLNIVRFLTDECGVDPSCRDTAGFAPLDYAVLGQSVIVISYLIKERHYNNEDLKRILHLVTVGGDLQVVMHLIEECGVDPESCRDDDGQTLLHTAAATGQLGVTRYLTQGKHCDPMCKDKSGYTALHTVAMCGQLEAARYLIDECGVNPESCRDNKGCTPLHTAAAANEFEILKYFINTKHCDPMCRDGNGATPLHSAAGLGRLRTVQCLIDECGVDHELCLDENGLTPLHDATISEKLNVVEYLTKEKHCDLMHRDGSGITAVLYAALQGSAQIVQYFIDECGVHPELIQQVDELKTAIAKLSQPQCREEDKKLGMSVKGLGQ